MILNCYFTRKKDSGNVLLIKYHDPLQLYSSSVSVTYVIVNVEFDSFLHNRDYIKWGPYKLYNI